MKPKFTKEGNGMSSQLMAPVASGFPAIIRTPIIDSELSDEQAIRPDLYPWCSAVTLANLEVITTEYMSNDNLLHQGQVVIAQECAPTMQEGLAIALNTGFVIHSMIPIAEFASDKYAYLDPPGTETLPLVVRMDLRSMLRNNSTAFHSRTVHGGAKMSSPHEVGAFDINPEWNPERRKGRLLPHTGRYLLGRPGTLYRGLPMVDFFCSKDLMWGGHFVVDGDGEPLLDPMHFQPRKKNRCRV